MKEKMMKRKSVNGFTLIEMLVVVLIIGILAAIALPQYNKTFWKSRFLQAKTLAKNIADAEEVFYMINGRYTKNLFELDIDVPTPNSSFAYASETEYYYDWGACSLNYNDSRAAVFCSIYRNGSEYLIYRISNVNTNYYTNKRLCIANSPGRKPTENDINYKICQEETGNISGGWGSTSLYWVYK